MEILVLLDVLNSFYVPDNRYLNHERVNTSICSVYIIHNRFNEDVSLNQSKYIAHCL